MVNDLPDTPDNKCYRRILTQAANHLLQPAHPDSDMRHHINGRYDVWASIDGSRKLKHLYSIRYMSVNIEPTIIVYASRRVECRARCRRKITIRRNYRYFMSKRARLSNGQVLLFRL